jgi:hypothetical protein
MVKWHPSSTHPARQHAFSMRKHVGYTQTIA